MPSMYTYVAMRTWHAAWPVQLQQYCALWRQVRESGLRQTKIA